MRTVVTFEPLGADRVIFKLTQAVADVPGMGDNDFVDVSPLPAGDAMARGEVLRQRLGAHAPVRTGVERALGVPPGGEPAPLYFQMGAAMADELPWEQLYAAPHGFCALDRRWPVGRIAKLRREVTDRAFEKPLRIVAVLSAAGRSGLPQLDGLLAATNTEDARAVRVHLHVITGQEAVRDKALAAGRPEVTAELIGPDAAAVVRRIGAARPHLLHVLGHSGLVAGVPTLAFATIGDFDDDRLTTGTVRLTLSQIVDSLAGTDPWLVVLNACDTAEVANGQALAHGLASAGVPAVIGMRRLVDLADADRFCASLYPEVLALVRKAVAPDGPAQVRIIDWATALTVPRVVLSGQDPAAVDTWSDPVLYVQADPFRAFAPSEVLTAEQYADLRGELDVWEGYLAKVEDPDDDVRAEVEAHIARLRARLPAPGR